MVPRRRAVPCRARPHVVRLVEQQRSRTGLAATASRGGCGTIREWLEAQLLWQGRCDGVPPASRRARSRGHQRSLWRQRDDAPLWRRVLADLHDRRQHRPRRDRLDEELHPARDPHFRRRRSRAVLPVPCRVVPRAVSPGGGRAGVGHRHALRRTRRMDLLPRRSGAGDGARRTDACRVCRGHVGHQGVPVAAPRRQRVQGLRARRVHDAAGDHQSPPAHVARPGMAVHATRRRPDRWSDNPRGGSPDA